MNKKILLFLFSFFTSQIILIKCYSTAISYSITTSASGLIEINDMTITIPGYQTVILAADRVITYPDLFTTLYDFLSDNHLLTTSLKNRTWLFPLSLGFKIQNNTLTIFSKLFINKLITVKQIINLIPNGPVQLDQEATLTININGQICEINQDTVIQIFQHFPTTLAL